MRWLKKIDLKGEIIDSMCQRRERDFLRVRYVTDISLRSELIYTLVPQVVDELTLSVINIPSGKRESDVYAEIPSLMESGQYEFGFKGDFGGLYVIKSSFQTNPDNYELMGRVLCSEGGTFGQEVKTIFLATCLPLRLESEDQYFDPEKLPLNIENFDKFHRVSLSIRATILDLPLYKLRQVSSGDLLPGFTVKVS